MRSSLMALLACGVLSGAPAIRDIHPHGAQTGTSFKLTLEGDGLLAGSTLQTSIPGAVSRLVTKEDTASNNAAIVFLVELKKDAQPGLYPLRLVTSNGISNLMLFSVGVFPEIEEKESTQPKPGNGKLENAEPIPVPVTVNGTLTAADIDTYKFAAKAGERLVFEVEARRAGSAIDPLIEVMDSAGKVIASNDDAVGLGVDARVEVTFPKAGTYYAQVRDTRYSDQAQDFYRLKIGQYPYADSIFPLGGKRGETVEITMAGGNLPAPVKVTKKLDTTAGYMPVQLPGSAALPMILEVGDQPEEIEPVVVREGVLVNGRISAAGEIDKYKLAVAPGEEWVVNLSAGSLGTSQLDPIITVFDEKGKKLFSRIDAMQTAYDEKGKKLLSRDDSVGGDPALVFKVPEGVHQLTVAVEDLLGRGGAGYGYRMQARRGGPDFVVDIATPFVNVPAGGTAAVVVNVRRRGFEGPIELKIPNLPEGYQVSGGHVPSDAAAQNPFNDNIGFRGARSVLTITAPADAKPMNTELHVIAEADTPSGKIVRRGVGSGLVTGIRGDRKAFIAPWLGLDLPMAVSRPLPVKVTVPVPLVRISQGFEYPLQYAITRAPNAKVMGKVDNAISGNVGNLRILQGPASKSPDSGTVLVATNFATPVTTFDMLFDVPAEVDGKLVRVTSPAVQIEVVPGYEVRLENATLELGANGKGEMRGTVRREPTFEGSSVRVQLEDLPDHVTCKPVEVAADQTSFSIPCESATAEPGNYETRITSSAPNVGRKAKSEYKIADLPAKLVVRGEAKPEVGRSARR